MTSAAVLSPSVLSRRANRRRLVVSAATILLGVPLLATTPAAPPPAAASGSPGFHLEKGGSFTERRNAKGGWDRTSIEPSFRVVEALLSYQHGVDMLLVQRLETTAHSDAEQADSKLEVSGWISGTQRYDKKLWSLTDAADEGRLAREWNLFEAIKYGCCGGEDVHDYYSLKTGRLLGTASSDHPAAALLSIPNTATYRVVAYQSDNAARGPATPGHIENLLGVLTLGSEDGIEHRVAVTAKGVEAWTPRLTLRLAGKSEDSTNLDLFAADFKSSPAGLGGCLVRLVFEDTKEVLVPIAAADFDLAHATLPSGFHLQRLADPGR